MRLSDINPRNMPGPGDPETWDRPTLRRPQSQQSPADKDRQYGAERDFEDRQNQQARKKQQAKFETKFEGGHMNREFPDGNVNGKQYNAILTINADDEETAKGQLRQYKDANWGAQEIVAVKKRPSERGVEYKIFIVDNHKYGHFQPFQD